MAIETFDIGQEPLPKISVNFGLRSDTLVPDEITKLIGTKPTYAFMKGDEFDSRSGRHERLWGIWQLRSCPNVSSGDLNAHIRYILDIIEPKRNVIEAFLKDSTYYAEIRIRWKAEYSVCSFSLSSDLLRRLSAICHQLVISCTINGAPEE